RRRVIKLSDLYSRRHRRCGCADLLNPRRIRRNFNRRLQRIFHSRLGLLDGYVRYLKFVGIRNIDAEQWRGGYGLGNGSFRRFDLRRLYRNRLWCWLRLWNHLRRDGGGIIRYRLDPASCNLRSAARATQSGIDYGVRVTLFRDDSVGLILSDELRRFGCG